MKIRHLSCKRLISWSRLIIPTSLRCLTFSRMKVTIASLWRWCKAESSLSRFSKESSSLRVKPEKQSRPSLMLSTIATLSILCTETLNLKIFCCTPKNWIWAASKFLILDLRDLWVQNSSLRLSVELQAMWPQRLLWSNHMGKSAITGVLVWSYTSFSLGHHHSSKTRDLICLTRLRMHNTNSTNLPGEISLKRQKTLFRTSWKQLQLRDSTANRCLLTHGCQWT